MLILNFPKLSIALVYSGMCENSHYTYILVQFIEIYRFDKS